MKQLLLLTVCMCFGLQLYASTPFEDQGLSWKLEKNVLTISKTGNGNGEMPPYVFGNNNNNAPWHNSKNAITHLVIEEGVTSIGDYAFENYTALTSVSIAGSVKKIGAYAFSSCTKLTSIKLPEGLQTIGYRSFYFCSGLVTATIPNSLTTILDEGFASCINLTDLYTKAIVPPTCKTMVFAGIPSDCKLYVPKDSKSAYEKANTWKDFNPILIDESKDEDDGKDDDGEDDGKDDEDGKDDDTAMEEINGVTIYLHPNPATEGFYVNGINNETTRLTLFNMNGKTVFSKIVKESEYISIESLTSGMYIVKLETLDGIVTRKLIKQ
ncbi:MAG: leucine-rich repeat domain-containing protein [Tannerella sp.]|jgi:hypothetical protein|nr:leucine-rich repeat domain-containing protein [Tannerella sp.]